MTVAAEQHQDTMTELPAFLKAEEVAEYLRVPLGTLRHWVQINYGPPSFRMGRLRRWQREALLEWVDRQMRGWSA